VVLIAGGDSNSQTTKEHPVRLFVMGTNQCVMKDEWPLARAQNQKFYLTGNGAPDD